MGKPGPSWLYGWEQFSFCSGGCLHEECNQSGCRKKCTKPTEKGANSVHPKVSTTGRRGYEYYNKLGYVPYDVKINENAARTLEYAYDDWCIYRMGEKLAVRQKNWMFIRKGVRTTVICSIRKLS